jgi:hypothetical protein
MEINPREIEVHIEELILHGCAPGQRWEIGDALENELRALLAEKGLPAGWLASPAQIDAGTIRLTRTSTAGAQIAEAIHRKAGP